MDEIMDVNLYSAAGNLTGRKQHSEEVKRLYLNGETKRAQRKAKEYNSKVTDKMAPYYAEYADMADDIAETVNDNLYIKIQDRTK